MMKGMLVAGLDSKPKGVAALSEVEVLESVAEARREITQTMTGVERPREFMRERRTCREMQASIGKV